MEDACPEFLIMPSPTQGHEPHACRLPDTNVRSDDCMFRQLVELLNCVVVILRRDRSVAYANAFAEQFTGHAATEIAGRDALELLIPESARPEVERRFHAALGGNDVSEIEHLLVTRRGPVRWVLSSFRPISDQEGKPAVLLMSQDVTVHRHAERELRRRTHDLGERIKELNCLFGLSKLVEDPDMDVDRICAGLVEILPPSWQYPEHTCARVVFRGKEYRTYNYQQTRWRQTARIEVCGLPAGLIEVDYLEEKPEAHEGPFLVEERRLLNALAERMGRIAEREQIEDELRREKDFAESLIETAPAIVLVLDPEGHILRINRYMEEFSGYALADVQGEKWLDTFVPPAAHQRMSGLTDTSQLRTTELIGPVRTRAGDEREVEWYTKTLTDPEGELVGFLAVGRDITLRRRLEKEIVDISTREQQRIGQELHDGLGQELTGLGYLAQMLFCDLQQRNAPETETANQLADGVEKALEQTRTIARGLVPVEIDADGLLNSLEQLAEQTERRFGITCRVFCDTPTLIDDTATAAQLFRIVREAVNNATKHAQASRITIEAQNGSDSLVFTIRDDGIGMPLNTESSHGMGLRIMQHRAGVIGAVLSFGPAEEGGTLVTCTIPRNGNSRSD